ncbi:nascent polypeptide-associated complex subunit alpha, muscle-specific form-like [Camelus ferus]|uniref:Nascent polypeptide-associated complex subunit alpha, muscle-specific form-like n=1 Tax=Camelus ferus TaxID=419612 RepID=A0A8B8SHM8_CAMFR|nr:nascent polypeptide-associated complex subunit alpha, muscle-specific form-like [Camelus ferus]
MWVVKEELKSEEVMCPWTAFLRIPDSPDPPEGSCDAFVLFSPLNLALSILAATEATVPSKRHAGPSRCSPKPHQEAPFALRSGPGSNSSGPGWAPLCAGRCRVRAAPRSPGGRSTAVPALRPAATRPRAPLVPLPGAASPAPRRLLGLGAPGAAASLPPAARPRRRRRRRAPPTPPPRGAPGEAAGGRRGRAGRWTRGPRRGAPPPPHPGQVCAGRRSSRAARRAAPRASAALLPRRPLPARSPPDTDAAFSCRRITLEPPRLLRKKGKRKTVRRPAEQRPAPAQPSECGAAQLDCEPYRSETLPQACLAPGTQRPQQVAGQLEGRRGRNTVELLSGAQAEASGMARRPHRRAASHTLSGQRSEIIDISRMRCMTRT